MARLRGQIEKLKRELENILVLWLNNLFLKGTLVLQIGQMHSQQYFVPLDLQFIALPSILHIIWFISKLGFGLVLPQMYGLLLAILKTS